ncbi:hypothetical protein HDU98_002668, partial [Podochytrium sp. JEL0797]
VRLKAAAKEANRKQENGEEGDRPKIEEALEKIVAQIMDLPDSDDPGDRKAQQNVIIFCLMSAALAEILINDEKPDQSKDSTENIAYSTFESSADVMDPTHKKNLINTGKVVNLAAIAPHLFASVAANLFPKVYAEILHLLSPQLEHRELLRKIFLFHDSPDFCKPMSSALDKNTITASPKSLHELLLETIEINPDAFFVETVRGLMELKAKEGPEWGFYQTLALLLDPSNFRETDLNWASFKAKRAVGFFHNGTGYCYNPERTPESLKILRFTILDGLMKKATPCSDFKTYWDSYRRDPNWVIRFFEIVVNVLSSEKNGNGGGAAKIGRAQRNSNQKRVVEKDGPTEADEYAELAKQTMFRIRPSLPQPVGVVPMPQPAHKLTAPTSVIERFFAMTDFADLMCWRFDHEFEDGEHEVLFVGTVERIGLRSLGKHERIGIRALLHLEPLEMNGRFDSAIITVTRPTCDTSIASAAVTSLLSSLLFCFTTDATSMDDIQTAEEIDEQQQLALDAVRADAKQQIGFSLAPVQFSLTTQHNVREDKEGEEEENAVDAVDASAGAGAGVGKEKKVLRIMRKQPEVPFDSVWEVQKSDLKNLMGSIVALRKGGEGEDARLVACPTKIQIGQTKHIKFDMALQHPPHIAFPKQNRNLTFVPKAVKVA